MVFRFVPFLPGVTFPNSLPLVSWMFVLLPSPLLLYSVTQFHYYRCCIYCYPVLLLYPVTYFPSCHCYAHRYPVLSCSILWLTSIIIVVVYIAIQSSCFILSLTSPRVIAMHIANQSSTALYCNSLLFLSLLYALLHSSISDAVVNTFFSSVSAVLSLKMSDITFYLPILSSARFGIFHVGIHILNGNICEW